MKNRKLLILAGLLLNAVAFSQNLQTNNQADSVKVAISDMDKATFKMIEGKQAKEKLVLVSGALSSCDSIKVNQKHVIKLQELNSAGLKQQNANLTKIVEDLKITVKNEKSAKLRRGFFGFLKGFVAGAIITSAFFIAN